MKKGLSLLRPPNALVQYQLYFSNCDAIILVQNFTKEKAVKQLTPYLAQDTMQFVKALFDNVENADAVKGNRMHEFDHGQFDTISL